MKKVLFALGLFCAAPAFSTPQLTRTDALADRLELESGRLVDLEQRRFFVGGLNCLKFGLECDNKNIFQDIDVEARYCITRCTGTGKDRVCYEICYED